MNRALKESVYEANIDLVKKGLVTFTWGNVSEIDRAKGLVAIKPSGIEYENMCPDDMVLVDFDSGAVVEGKWRPSSDLQTHLKLYRAFPQIGGITHTHSVNAVAFAQAGQDIPVLGTTHADYFYGPIPCTRELTKAEVEDNYELNTGSVIVECIQKRGIDPLAVPGIVVKNHGPFSWGKNAAASVYHAVVLDVVAEMNIKTMLLNPSAKIEQYILDKHYFRKHGSNAYYGQNNN